MNNFTRNLIIVLGLLLCMFLTQSAYASVQLYVDAAPNVYGSSDYEPWKTAAFAAAADGSFVNMANSYNPANVGTTNFHIRDEVVYSFGDLGRRLTWIYWIPGETVDGLQGRIEVKLENWWDGDYLDFYNDYYGSTWLEPTKIYNYDDNQGNTGVIGLGGMAWWGAYDTDTQEELEEDILAWQSADETWKFTVKLDGMDYDITSNRAAVPVPAAVWLLGSGLMGLIGMRRKMRS